MDKLRSAANDVGDSSRILGPSSTPTSEPVAPVIREFGFELPVLDPQAFERTSAFLPPEAVARHMRTIAGLGEALLRALREPGAMACAGDKLADAAHTLAGSAGMFGFQRLAAVGRRFEHAAQTGAQEAPVLAHALAAAVQTALLEIRSHAPASVDQPAEVRQNAG